eukprot:4101107-Prymnesium_polylepis.2
MREPESLGRRTTYIRVAIGRAGLENPEDCGHGGRMAWMTGKSFAKACWQIGGRTGHKREGGWNMGWPLCAIGARTRCHLRGGNRPRRLGAEERGDCLDASAARLVVTVRGRGHELPEHSGRGRGADESLQHAARAAHNDFNRAVPAGRGRTRRCT